MTEAGERQLFIGLEEGLKHLKSTGYLESDEKHIKVLIEAGLLPTFRSDTERLMLRYDLISMLPVLRSKCNFNDAQFPSSRLFAERSLNIGLDQHTRIELLPKSTQVEPAFYSAMRNLISTGFSPRFDEHALPVDMPYFSTARILTKSEEVMELVGEQQKRANMIQSSKSSQFANSAYYMGSKRSLGAFLVEALLSIAPRSLTVVDLMCGSGAASGAFSKVWRTIASDAQEFCRILALVQGGGFSTQQAQKLLASLMPIARENACKLRTQLYEFLDTEDAIFHSDISAALLKHYQEFVESLPTYPDGEPSLGWDPVSEVERRKKQPTLAPYCLFTSYFSNVYFGLRQCIEIDSLRFAIDQIEVHNERLWALGALVATVSALGTTYAGHFAQPVRLSAGNFPDILEKRAYSIMHEFSIRLLNLAEEAERSPNQIDIIPGPWPDALAALDALFPRNGQPIAVYVDAPYKRDEYSRYYHVLETAVLYSYPSCIGSGKIPSKSTGERFRSGFFTRSETELIQILVNLFGEILERGWMCAWSYAESGNASIVTVVEEVFQATGCEVRSYSTPYQHKAQSGRSARNTTEYLVLFIPKAPVHRYKNR